MSKTTNKANQVKSYRKEYDFNVFEPNLNNYPIAPTGQVLEKGLIHGVQTKNKDLTLFSVYAYQQFISQKNSSPKAKPESGVYPFTRNMNETLQSILNNAYLMEALKKEGINYIVECLKGVNDLKDMLSITIESKTIISSNDLLL